MDLPEATSSAGTAGATVPAPAGPVEIPAARARGLWLRENIEAIAVAVIIALLIRHFCVEAFKIPTGSMEPTLIGKEINGDRILVNKFLYRLRAPRRFEIVVFRYPLDRSRNFVKRLVGLPGEEIELRRGDVYADGRIARKPRRLQAEMFANWCVYPAEPPCSDWRVDFETASPQSVASVERGFRIDSPGEVVLRYRREVTNGGARERFPVGDRLVRAAFSLEGLAGTAILFLDEGADRFRLELASRAEGGGLRLFRNGEPIAERAHLSLVPGRRTTIALSNPDDTVIVAVDGRDAVRLEYEPLSLEPTPQAIGFGLRGGAAAVSEVAICRDLYYTPEGRTRVVVPEDSLFVLGDNSPASKDGRLWVGRQVILEDGTTLFGDADARLDLMESPADLWHSTLDGFTDEFGETYTADETTLRYGPRENRPFVPKSLLLGKAFFVFWPPMRHDPEGWRINWKFVE